VVRRSVPFPISRERLRTHAWTAGAIGGSLVLLIPGAFAFAPRQQFARLGDFRLESGEIIADAVVGYRTAGQLNAARSNAVLVAPWFQGTTGQVARQIGPGKLVDTSKYFVIMVDALGNGVSSSPSTSARQPDQAFPAFTIADIVASQYQLVTRILGLNHLHAIVGISMGGMQVFQWVVSHPQFMSRAVTIVGSPQSQPDDRQRWADGIEWLRQPAWTRTRLMLSRIRPRSAVNELRTEPHDHIRQAEAIMALDISRPFQGSMERAAAAIHADLMVVSTWADREVNPKPAFDLARIASAHVLELDGRCGHQAPSCERKVMWSAVARFLDR
jgi:homoserine O-acetyltransferase/O-succinyltransferase